MNAGSRERANRANNGFSLLQTRFGGAFTDAEAIACLVVLRRLLLLAVAVEAWNALHFDAYREAPLVHLLLAAGQLPCLVAGWLGYHARVAIGVSAALLAAGMLLVFPYNANHQYVELLALGFVGLAREEPEQARVALSGAQGLLVIGFAWAGFQKLLWGAWFGGEFLAHRIAFDPAFAEVFQLLLPASELERLRALGDAPGAGPFRVAHPFFLLISNGTWLAEIALAALLCLPRTRRAAAVGVMLFVVAIQLGARELFFAGLMLNFALLFLGGAIYSRALPIFAVAYAAVLAMLVGLLPRMGFG